jgi:hypothetical protein
MNIEGLRLVLTYECRNRCNFCYQKSYDKTIDLKTLELFLKILHKQKFKYLNIMGGEVLHLKDYMTYLKLIHKYFPQRKKLITSTIGPFTDIQKLNYVIATSNNYSGDIINLYYDGGEFTEYSALAQEKPIVLCGKMGAKLNPPIILGIKPKKINDFLYIYDKLNIKYFNDNKNYCNSELILTPHGRLTNDFRDIKNGL